MFLKKSYITLRQAVRKRRWDDPTGRVHPVKGGEEKGGEEKER